MAFISSYPASFSRVKTKADLKRVVKEINESETAQDIDVQVEDYHNGVGSGLVNLRDFFRDFPQHTLQMSNHPKRSWYASVSFANGKIKVS